MQIEAPIMLWASNARAKLYTEILNVERCAVRQWIRAMGTLLSSISPVLLSHTR